jgi:hypothetical protein
MKKIFLSILLLSLFVTFSFAADQIAKVGYYKNYSGAACDDEDGWTEGDIEDAITASGSGSTTYLCDGTYRYDDIDANGILQFSAANQTLTSVNGKDSVILTNIIQMTGFSGPDGYGQYTATVTTEPAHCRLSGTDLVQGTYNSLSAGEWDWDSNTLYVYGDPSTNLYCTQADYIVRVIQAGCTISGITMEYANDAVVSIEAINTTIEDNNINWGNDYGIVNKLVVYDDYMSSDNTSDWTPSSANISFTYDGDIYYNLSTDNASETIYNDDGSYIDGKTYVLRVVYLDGTAASVDFDLYHGYAGTIEGYTNYTSSTKTYLATHEFTASASTDRIGIRVNDDLNTDYFKMRRLWVNQVYTGLTISRNTMTDSGSSAISFNTTQSSTIEDNTIIFDKWDSVMTDQTHGQGIFLSENSNTNTIKQNNIYRTANPSRIHGGGIKLSISDSNEVNYNIVGRIWAIQ